jgi:integrase
MSTACGLAGVRAAVPEWVFPSVAGPALDGSNVRKAFDRILDAAGLHRRGPHQMRHTFASPLLSAGVPILYVSRQLGHRDPSITLHVYSHWMPAASDVRAVDLLDDARQDARKPINTAALHRTYSARKHY